MQGLWNLIGKNQGPGRDFNFEIGDLMKGCDGKSIWTVHFGKNKTNGSPVTVFSIDAKIAPPDEFQVAKSACKRLRSIRHPNVLRFIDSYESDALIYMVTEPIVPLVNFLESDWGKSPSILAWGIHQIATALSFMVNDSNLCHGNINLYSVFVDPAGEWKLGAVEYVHMHGSEPVAKLPSLGRYDPPEGKAPRRKENWSTDSWGFGCLIWEIFNGPMLKSSELKAVSKIPRNLLSHYCELVTANPKSRLNPKNFLQSCKEPGQYLDNDFVKANLFLQEIQIKDISEQREFFQSLNKSLDTFPVAFSIHKILPELLKAFQFGAAGSSVLGPLFKIGKLLEDDEYQKKIVPCVVKLFSSNDRATRIQLLQQMDQFVQHLQPALVNDQVFPNVATGFGDTLPAMREQTVKSMILLAPKLSEKTINNQLLRYFAKLQMDEQPGIRTNTTICLGKIATNLPEATRQKMLIPAFLRSLRDPFPPARSAGILALAATQDFYSLQDIACKILPALCSATIDNEKSVRDNTFKAIKTFMSKVEDASSNPESRLNSKGNEGAQEAGSSTWTGWAVSSLTSRIYGQQEAKEKQVQAKEVVKPQVNNENPAASKEKTNVEVPAAKQAQTDQSESEYGDAWSDDNWEDVNDEDTFSSMRNDLVGAKEEISNFSKLSVKEKDDGGSSDSDYGDWGGDDWGFNDKMPAKPKVKTKQAVSPSKIKQKNEKPVEPSPRSVADLLGLGQEKTDEFLDIGASAPFGLRNDDDSVWPPKIQQKPQPVAKVKSQDSSFHSKPFGDEQKPKTRNSSSSKHSNKREEESTSGWNVEEEGDWGGEDWGEMDEGDTPNNEADAAAVQAREREAKKAELKRIREERRQQREQTMKERKGKGGGAMKLGGVKKVAKDSFD
eukprot:Seg4000.2 transcript_id=Seg4000.2/GoldUCD/mRNA.D3Y31 product="N-terminal kinase-like protein" protein_id=Seg4000.2/GoldUCD/D3Y31